MEWLRQNQVMLWLLATHENLYYMYEYVSTFCNGRPCPNPNCLQVIYPFQSSCGSYKFNCIHSLEKIIISHQSLKIKHLQGSCELLRLHLHKMTLWDLGLGLWTGTWIRACLISMYNIRLMSNIFNEDFLLCQTS